MERDAPEKHKLLEAYRSCSQGCSDADAAMVSHQRYARSYASLMLGRCSSDCLRALREGSSPDKGILGSSAVRHRSDTWLSGRSANG